MRSLMIAVKMTLVLTVALGIVYPLAMVGMAHIVFPAQAEGSLIYRDGVPIGSSLMGQNFKSPKYFHSRPSAAGNNGYDPTSSSGSNLAPTSKSLIDSVKSRLKDVLEENPGIGASQVPVDMLTASGSGLDPEISPAAAEIQVQRVAKARGISEQVVQSLVDSTRTLDRASQEFLANPGLMLWN